MQKLSYTVLLSIIILTGVVLYFAHPLGWYTTSSSIPLGYDPGLYKLVFEQTMFLLAEGTVNWSLLPPWIQSMYPPLIGMIYGLWGMIVGSDVGLSATDRIVRLGIVWCLLLLSLGLYTYAQRLFRDAGGFTSSTWENGLPASAEFLSSSNQRWLWGLVFFAVVMSSFVLYQLYWRGYFKQILAGTMVMSGFAVLLNSTRKSLIVPGMLLLLGSVVMQRPAIVLVVAGLFFLWILENNRVYRKRLLIGSALTGVVAYFWYGSMIEQQIVSLIIPVFQKFGGGGVGDGFQAGGTFLTIGDYITTNRIIGLGGVVGTIMMLTHRNKTVRFHGLMVAFLLVRVVGKGYFFQRMLGYLEFFLIPGCAYLFANLLQRCRWWLTVGVLCFVGAQFALNFYRQQRVRFPLIESSEFAFIGQINTLIDNNAIIVVPGIYYSPWIAGRTDAQVIAPGLFDLNTWGDATQGRYDHRRNASAQEKCAALKRDYYNANRGSTFYVWVGSKQPATPMDGACFTRLDSEQSGFYTFYGVRFADVP